MQLDLTGRHALVCGASQDIGRACAIELALLGADVTVLARRADVLAALANELPRSHAAQRHGFLVADVADTDTLRRQADELVAAHPVHILINNSGGPPPGDIATAEPAVRYELTITTSAESASASTLQKSGAASSALTNSARSDGKLRRSSASNVTPAPRSGRCAYVTDNTRAK